MTEAADALPPLRLPERLTDGVVVLDAHTLADAEAHWEGEDEEMRRRFESPGRSTLEQTRAVMQRWRDARIAGRPAFVYALRNREGVLAGGCEIRLITPGRANVSYWVFPHFRGQGLAARALKLLSEAAVGVEGLAELEAHVDPDNGSSRQTAINAGYVETGTVEDDSDLGPPIARVLHVRRIARTDPTSV